MMRSLLAATLIAGALTVAASPAGQADDGMTPSWMKVDAGGKSVEMSIVAGWNANDGALNFNGYYQGGVTIRIPAGWRVDVKFSNHDGMLPHSMLVTKPYAEGQIPPQAGADQVAISKAYSRDPSSGIMAGQTDDVPFTVSDPGSFWLICGAPGHAVQGMWVKLEVVANLAQPAIVVAAGVPPGWK
jgi:sulfocyanin